MFGFAFLTLLKNSALHFFPTFYSRSLNFCRFTVNQLISPYVFSFGVSFHFGVSTKENSPFLQDFLFCFIKRHMASVLQLQGILMFANAQTSNFLISIRAYYYWDTKQALAVFCSSVIVSRTHDICCWHPWSFRHKSVPIVHDIGTDIQSDKNPILREPL